MTMRNRFLSGATVVLAVSMLGACSEAPEAGSDAAESTVAAAPAGGSDMAMQGQTIFAGSTCVACHGPQAGGTALAPDLTDGVWLNVEAGQPLESQIAAVIRTGVAAPKDPAHTAPMPPMGGGTFTDDQIAALAAYIVSLNP
jgi:mono/diheme cytochrome c family protein